MEFVDVDWWTMIFIIALIIIDYATGIMGAIVKGNFSSKIMRQGLIHKLAYILAMATGLIIDNLCLNLELGLVVGTAVLGLIEVWIIITEIGSICENLVTINPAFASNGFLRIFARQSQEQQLEAQPMLSEGVTDGDNRKNLQ